MAVGRHPDPSARARRGARGRRAGADIRRVALFASGLQLSDAPTAEMAAEAVTATMRRLGIHGCVSWMAQEFGDHPDAAAERMRWAIQLTAQLPARPRMPAGAGSASGRAGHDVEARSNHGTAAGLGTRPGCRRSAQGREVRDEPDL